MLTSGYNMAIHYTDLQQLWLPEDLYQICLAKIPTEAPLVKTELLAVCGCRENHYPLKTRELVGSPCPSVLPHAHMYMGNTSGTWGLLIVTRQDNIKLRETG